MSPRKNDPFKVNDGTSDSNVATISLTVTNEAPQASNASLVVFKNLTGAILLMANSSDADGDATTITITQGPSYGTLAYNNSTRMHEYTPDSDYVGADSFIYQVNDGVAYSSLATVSLTVTDIGPVAYNHTAIVYDDDTTPATENVLDNATDPENDPLSVVAVNGSTSNVATYVTGTYGALQVNADGSYEYNLDQAAPELLALQEGAMAVDRFTFTISDGNGNTSTAMVEVQVRVTRIRMDIRIAPLVFQQGQGNRMRVEINARTANALVHLKLGGMNGTMVPYFNVAAGGARMVQADNPIRAAANGRVVVFVPVDELPVGLGQTLWIGQPATPTSYSNNPGPQPSLLFRVIAAP